MMAHFKITVELIGDKTVENKYPDREELLVFKCTTLDFVALNDVLLKDRAATFFASEVIKAYQTVENLNG